MLLESRGLGDSWPRSGAALRRVARSPSVVGPAPRRSQGRADVGPETAVHPPCAPLVAGECALRAALAPAQPQNECGRGRRPTPADRRRPHPPDGPTRLPPTRLPDLLFLPGQGRAVAPTP